MNKKINFGNIRKRTPSMCRLIKQHILETDPEHLIPTFHINNIDEKLTCHLCGAEAEVWLPFMYDVAECEKCSQTEKSIFDLHLVHTVWRRLTPIIYAKYFLKICNTTEE